MHTCVHAHTHISTSSCWLYTSVPSHMKGRNRDRETPRHSLWNSLRLYAEFTLILNSRVPIIAAGHIMIGQLKYQKKLNGKVWTVLILWSFVFCTGRSRPRLKIINTLCALLNPFQIHSPVFLLEELMSHVPTDLPHINSQPKKQTNKPNCHILFSLS